jgi:hypothetical protein
MKPAPIPFPISGAGVVVSTWPSVVVEGTPVLVLLVVVEGITLVVDSVVLTVVVSLSVEPLVVVVITVVLATSSVVLGL